MLLDRVISDEHSLLYLERYVNGGARTYSSVSGINKVNERYQPTSDNAGFMVPFFEVPRALISQYSDNPINQLADFYAQAETVRFPVHPEILDDPDIPFLKEIRSFPHTELFVAPTASTRTVFVFESSGVPAHFLKLNCPRQISRFTRRLRHVTAQFSVQISKDLRDFHVDRFAYFPETIALAVGDLENGWGSIIREYAPRPMIEGRRWYIPFFALYSSDVRSNDEIPLLVQLINHHQADPIDFTFRNIIRPSIEIWCRAYLERGIFFESHGQNTLLEIDEHFIPTRIVHRDLDVIIDPLQRAKRGLDTEFHKNRIGYEYAHASAQVVASLMYDSFMGHHCFDYIVHALEKAFSIQGDDLRILARNEFTRLIPDSHTYFPQHVHYYENSTTKLSHEIGITDTGKNPQWR